MGRALLTLVVISTIVWVFWMTKVWLTNRKNKKED